MVLRTTSAQLNQQPSPSESKPMKTDNNNNNDLSAAAYLQRFAGDTSIDDVVSAFIHNDAATVVASNKTGRLLVEADPSAPATITIEHVYVHKMSPSPSSKSAKRPAAATSRKIESTGSTNVPAKPIDHPVARKRSFKGRRSHPHQQQAIVPPPRRQRSVSPLRRLTNAISQKKSITSEETVSSSKRGQATRNKDDGAAVKGGDHSRSTNRRAASSPPRGRSLTRRAASKQAPGSARNVNHHPKEADASGAKRTASPLRRVTDTLASRTSRAAVVAGGHSASSSSSRWNHHQRNSISPTPTDRTAESSSRDQSPSGTMAVTKIFDGSSSSSMQDPIALVDGDSSPTPHRRHRRNSTPPGRLRRASAVLSARNVIRSSTKQVGGALSPQRSFTRRRSTSSPVRQRIAAPVSMKAKEKGPKKVAAAAAAAVGGVSDTSSQTAPPPPSKPSEKVLVYRQEEELPKVLSSKTINTPCSKSTRRRREMDHFERLVI